MHGWSQPPSLPLFEFYYGLDGMFWLYSSHLGKWLCLCVLKVLGHCVTPGVRGQGVLSKATLTTVGPSSHMRSEIKFPCQLPGKSYLYKNRTTLQNLPFPTNSMRVCMCAEQDSLTSPALLYWATIRQCDQLHHWLGFETFPRGCQPMTSCSASLHYTKSTFTSDQKMDFLDLLIPECGLVIVISQKIKADFPYRWRTKGGLESSTSTRAGNLKGPNVDD